MSNLKKVPLAQTTLSNDFSDTYKSEVDSAFQNSHTHSNKTVLDTVSGTNTGDETQTTILSKLCANKVTCSTDSATAEKAVTISGFSLIAGATIQVAFTNANTATTPTLNINSTGAKSIYSEDGTVCSSTNPLNIPAGATVEFTYNGTSWVYKNRVITNYYNNGSFYRIWTNGFIEQGGVISPSSTTNNEETITFLKAFSDANYKIIKNVNILSSFRTDTYWYQGLYRCYNLTATTFTTINTTTSYITNSSWYACGF